MDGRQIASNARAAKSVEHRSGKLHERGLAVTRPGGRPPGDTRPDPALCELLVCLLSPKVLTERFEKRLEELGLNVDQLRRCLKVWCRQGRKGESSVAAIATLLERPHMIAALRKLLDDETAC